MPSAGNIEVKVDTRKMDALLNGLGPKADKVLDTAAFYIQWDAQGFAPIDTGALKGSIKWRKSGPFERTISDSVEYGIYQEFGTKYMGAQPFMTPALEKERGPFKAAWKELMK